jgi:very-short-patch-repair endonuclease
METNGPRLHISPILLERARSMRHDSVPAERKLWYFLRNRRLNGFKFRRQQAIGPFIADFYCSEVGLIVELDGDSHVMRQAYDARRTKWLNENGHEVVRFTNHNVHDEMEAVLTTILRHCEERWFPRS